MKFYLKRLLLLLVGIYNEFIDEFKENINNICFIPKIIIFNPTQKEFLDLNNKDIINHPFYNSGGVQTRF